MMSARTLRLALGEGQQQQAEQQVQSGHGFLNGFDGTITVCSNLADSPAAVKVRRGTILLGFPDLL
jgi:hypothetical protein